MNFLERELPAERPIANLKICASLLWCLIAGDCMVLGINHQWQRMADSRTNTGGSSVSRDRHFSDGIKASSGRSVWVSPEPLPDIIKELICRFPEVIELPDEKIKHEMDDWIAKELVAKSLDRKL